MDLFLIAAMASAIGFLGALLGVGGGTFLVPALVLVIKMPLLQAISVGMVCSLATSIGGLLKSKFDEVTLKQALTYEPAALTGAMLAAPLAYVIAGRVIFLLFGMLVLLLAWLVASNRVLRSKAHWCYGVASGFIAGACSGLFGIGGGIVLIPMLRIFLHTTHAQAACISLFIMMSTSTVGLLVHLSLGSVPWSAGLACVIGSMPMAAWAAKLRPRVSEKTINRLFVVCATAISCAIFYKAICGVV